MESFDVEEVAGYANAIITFVINGSTTKLPLKDKDMCTAINIKGKMFNMALQSAKIALRETYGIILCDVPDLKTGKAHIAISEDTSKSMLLFDPEQQRQLTLLFVVLSYLFMRSTDAGQDHSTSEEDLINFLNGLRIYFDQTHEYFGSNVKKLITETFIKQLYLKREKVVSEFDSEAKFFYAWGYRAHMEFNKKLVLEAAAKIMKKPIAFFVAKYKEVYADESEQMET